MKNPIPLLQTPIRLGLAALATLPALASSHREAPLITSTPKIDCSDFYAFNSYETGRTNYVTLVANYIPLQDAYGGPNYFQLDTNALYEIHVDNTGDAREDLTFQFRFQNTPRNIALEIGSGSSKRTNSVPVLAVGPITAGNNASLNVDQTYTLSVIQGLRRSGTATPLTNSVSGVFTKPQDYVGTKTFPDYNAYADQYIYSINLPGTTNKAKIFVAQRKDPFVVNLGETFDLINISTSPLGPEDANRDSLADKNVTSIMLEIPKEFLRGAGANGGIIGAWSTASLIQNGQTNQLSRLGMPLVNEVVIGIRDKDKFNTSEPKDDLANFAENATMNPIICAAGLQINCCHEEAAEPPRKNNGTLAPSKGGRGMRLKAISSRFSEKITPRIIVAKCANPPSSAGLTMLANLKLSGTSNHPAARPMRMQIAAAITSSRFAAGPAIAIHAALRGFRSAQRRLYGALAQPIIHIRPLAAFMKNVMSGTTTMPIGSRRMCGIGSSETCPP